MKRFALSLLLSVCAASTFAGPLEDGVAAFRAKDYALALQLWQPLAEAGDADAQYNLGLLYQKGWGVEHNPRLAHDWYVKAVNQGHADAMYNLALMYAQGEGLFRSDRQAVQLLEHAAARGHVPATYTLGVMVAYGMGTRQDSTRAIELWERAATGGSRDAAAALARAYREGMFGLPADAQRAARWQRLVQ